MNEISIKLGINPLEILGANDINLGIIKKHYPGLKIIARGNEIKAYGIEEELNDLNSKVEQMIQLHQQFGNLNETTVERIFLASANEYPLSVNDKNMILLYGVGGKMIKAKTPGQVKMVELSEKNDVVIAIGAAGTGKTYTAVALAVRALKNKEFKRIVLTRPAVEAGESLGFLPGDLREKIDPYLQPLYDALEDMLPLPKLMNYLENGIIEIAPLAYMRGRTLNNAFVILDEAQNTTKMQLKMFLTRMGPSAKFIVTGDITQIDLPENQKSGLIHAEKILKNIKGIEFVYLTEQDVVRHKLVKAIIRAYENHSSEDKINH